MEKVVVTKNQIIEQLARSSHGKLDEYLRVGTQAAQHEPEFLAHLIAWNHKNGQIRDAKVALPAIQLGNLPNLLCPEPVSKIEDHPLAQNALAHMASLDPRNFVRALDFASSKALGRHKRAISRLAERYLRHREASYGLWESAVIQHRASMKRLYAYYHVKPGAEIFDNALFKGKAPKGSTLDIIRLLPGLEPKEALGHVLQRRIPFLVALGALGPKLRDTDVILGLINSMSPAELQNNAAMLDRLGVQKNPSLRAAFRDAISKLEKEVKTSAGVAMFKGSVAAKAVGGKTGEALARVQEKQLDKMKVAGRWCIGGDKSLSMKDSIEVSRFLGGHLARMAEACHLIFFDSMPYYKNVSGLTLEEIKRITAGVMASGGTQIHVVVDYLVQRKIEVDGFVIVSDGGDNSYGQNFVKAWKVYCQLFNKEPALYFWKVAGEDPDTFGPALDTAGIHYELMDLRRGVDYYSLPNAIATLKAQRYSLIDTIMETPLLTLDQVFTHKGEVHGDVAATA